MTGLRDVKLIKARQESERFEGKRITVSATLIEVDGSVEVPGRPGYVYVQERGQAESIYPAFNMFVEPLPELPVVLGYPYGSISEYEVMGVDRNFLDGTTWSGQTYVAAHRLKHQWPEGNKGVDAVEVYQPALQLLKTVADLSTLIVSVGGLRYEVSGVHKLFSPSVFDMTSYVPASGYASYNLLYLDVDTGFLAVEAGTAVVDSVSIPVPKPVYSGSGIPSAYIKLTGGQTAIVEANVEDARVFLTSGADNLDTASHAVLGPTEGIHVPYNWVFADATAMAVTIDPRTGVEYLATDIGKLALQADVQALWILTGTTPVWERVGISIHNELEQIQGGQTDEAYHLTELQHIGLTTLTATRIPVADAEGNLSDTEFLLWDAVNSALYTSNIRLFGSGLIGIDHVTSDQELALSGGLTAEQGGLIQLTGYGAGGSVRLTGSKYGSAVSAISAYLLIGGSTAEAAPNVGEVVLQAGTDATGLVVGSVSVLNGSGAGLLVDGAGWNYFAGNAGFTGGISTTPNAGVVQGFAFGWNPSGDGESVLSYGIGVGAYPRLDIRSWDGTTLEQRVSIQATGVVVSGVVSADPAQSIGDTLTVGQAGITPTYILFADADGRGVGDEGLIWDGNSLIVNGTEISAGGVYNAGISWEAREQAADDAWVSVCFGENIFAAIANSGAGSRLMTSYNGINWTTRTNPDSTQNWTSICYGNGIFVAVSETTSPSNQSLKSSDGRTWYSYPLGETPSQWKSVCYGGGLFVAVGHGPFYYVMTSSDGISWTYISGISPFYWESVCYGDGLFVAVARDGTGDRVMTSPDGINWTSQTAPTNAWRSVCYGNGTYVAVAHDNVMTSPDGINWTLQTSIPENSWMSVCYSNGLYVAVSLDGTGNRVMTSPDGVVWTSRVSAVDSPWWSVVYGNGLLVAVAPTGTYRVMTSGTAGVASYTHPTGDGNLHVPATGTTNEGKVLTAGSTAGSLSWETPTIGTVTDVSGTSPVSVATGTTTPVISMAAASAGVDGYMTGVYATKLDGIAEGATANVGTVTSVAALTIGTTGTDLSSTVANGTTTPVITLQVPTASATNRGALAAADWSLFSRTSNLPVDIYRCGFLNQTETTISFNDGTQIFTLGDAGSGWSYYRAGVKYTISGSKTIDLSAVVVDGSTYFIYIDATDGTLTASTVSWSLLDSKIPVSILMWDNTATPKYQLADERHTCLIDRRTHYYEHFGEGAKLTGRGALAGFTVNSDVDANKVFSIAASSMMDEDIIHSEAAFSKPNGTDLAYTVFYRISSSAWRWKFSSMPFSYATAGYIHYDNAGTLTQATGGSGSNARFVNSYLLITNIEGEARYAIVPGQAIFTTLASAQAENPANFTFTGFPIQEATFMYRLTWSTVTSTSSGLCRLAATPQALSVGSVSAVGSSSTIPVFTRGDILRGGAVGWEAYSALTTGAVLVGDGTDIVSTVTPTYAGVHNHGGYRIANVASPTTAGDVAIVGGALTPTHVLYADASGRAVGSANLVWDNTNTRLGVGITPTRRLDLLATGVTAGTDDQLRLTSARTAINASNLIGGIEFVSNDTNLTAGSQLPVSYIRSMAGGVHTATSLPSYMTFGVTPIDTVAPVEMMRIAPTAVLIGATAVTSSENFFEVKKDTVDASLSVIISTSNTSVTGDTSTVTTGIFSTLTHVVPSGYTNSGSMYGIYSQNFRNGTASVDSGTLKTQTGGLFVTGHNNTGAGSPITTTSTALDAITFLQSGSITTLYGLRVRVWGNTATVTNRWGISQEDTLAKNYFGGVVLLGTTTTASARLVIDSGTGNTGLVINRTSGASSIKAGATDGYLMLDSNGASLRLNHYVSDDVILVNGGGNVLIGTTTDTSGKLQVSGSAVVSSRLTVGTVTESSNILLKVNGSVTSTGDAYGQYVGINLTPADTKAAYFSYINGGVASDNTTAYAFGQYIDRLYKSGAGTVTNAYGLYVKHPTIGTNNYTAYFETSVGIGTTPSNQAALVASRTFTDTTTGKYYGASIFGYLNPASASSASVVGFRGIARTTSANDQNVTGLLYGVTSNAAHQGSGTVTALVGLSTSVSATYAGGTVTAGYGIIVEAPTVKQTAITAAITTYYGISVAGVPTASYGTTITTTYGLKIGDMTAGSTNYAIYTGLGAVRFGGEVTCASTINVITNYQLNGVTALSTGVVNLGSGNTVSGTLMASAIGYYCKATGANSLATGYYCEASSDRGIAMGSSSKATETLGIAIGADCVASGIRSMVLGSKANANGKQACFVWSDEVGCSAPDNSTFSVQATNGAFFSNYVSAVSGYKVNATTFIDSTSFSINLINATAPTVHTDNSIQIFSTDTGDATATLGLLLEQQIEAIGTFTASHKIKVNINGANYWLQLDAV